MKSVPKLWSQYEYYDPKIVLPKLQRLRLMLSASDLPSKVKNLRTRNLQPERESWDTAVFCYLMGRSRSLDIRFSRIEDSDYDSIFTWATEDGKCFAPIQMKEFVPKETNPSANLEKLLDSLKKYGDSGELIVGIKLNREASIGFRCLSSKDLSVAEVWMFGATTADQRTWSLFEETDDGWIKLDHALPDPIPESEMGIHDA